MLLQLGASLVLVSQLVLSQKFNYPKVTFKAFTPKGLRMEIPVTVGIKQFAVNANINREIDEIATGDFSANVVRPEINGWSYVDRDIELTKGDTLHYWVYYQHGKFGYRKGGLEWTVDKLYSASDASVINSECLLPSRTTVDGRSNTCTGSLILYDDFKGGRINESNWIIEHYIPFASPDYEFCSYQNDREVVFVENEKLLIKPRPDSDVRGILNLRNGCTRPNDNECEQIKKGSFILPPVTSGQIRTKLKFTYGKVEIRAKLPKGDWIYPQIYLESTINPNHKIIIAFTRGNNKLIDVDNQDVGGRKLIAGATTRPEQPEISRLLHSKSYTEPVFNEFHTYGIEWTSGKIIFTVDDSTFGTVTANQLEGVNFNTVNRMQLVLGVGVGGVNSFPDNSTSNGKPKPWINYERTQVKNFYVAKDDWINTWGGNSALQVDYVKILAI